ncbi:hypothetical protein QC760_007451 [Botrytis cinerea]
MAAAQPGQSKYVTLVSCDGFEYVVLREAACTSVAIKKMLDPSSGWEESQTGICRFSEIRYAQLCPFIIQLHIQYDSPIPG